MAMVVVVILGMMVMGVVMVMLATVTMVVVAMGAMMVVSLVAMRMVAMVSLVVASMGALMALLSFFVRVRYYPLGLTSVHVSLVLRVQISFTLACFDGDLKSS